MLIFFILDKKFHNIFSLVGVLDNFLGYILTQIIHSNGLFIGGFNDARKMKKKKKKVNEIKSKNVVKDCKPKESLTKYFDLEKYDYYRLFFSPNY
jgi:hypothetical protein